MAKQDMKERVKLIANTGAGKLRENPGRLEEVTRCLMDLGLKVDVAVGHPKRKLIPIARQAVKDGYPVVIAMGGDGTIGAVIEGIAGSQTHLGILAAGTANDIAHSLGIPEDLQEGCELIASDQRRALDLGLLSTKKRKKFPFFMITAVGLAATVYPKIKNVPEGTLAGVKEAIGAFLGYESHPKVTLILDDETKVEVETMLVMIANTPLVGLQNLVAPEASLEDGYLDISVYPGFSKAELLAYFARTANEASPADERVQRYRARKIKIKSKPKLDIAAEGMIFGKGTARIKVLHKALNVIAPPPGAGAEKPLTELQELPAPLPLSLLASQDA